MGGGLLQRSDKVVSMAEQQGTRSIAPLFTWRSAIAESELPPVTRHVLLTLSLYMNERGGSAYPGSMRIAHDSGLHVNTVKRALRDAVREGWLRVVSKGGSPAGGKRLATEYSATSPVHGLSDRVWTDRGHTSTGTSDAPDRHHTITRPVPEESPISSVITSENSRGSAPKNCVRCHGEGSFWDGHGQRPCDPHTFNEAPAAKPPWLELGISRDEWMRKPL